ncbi:MAG: PQQ-dependent sugar dehydrogenase, partial [Candidatus Harrisonbacteria bacterium]|nr:PQQ-dependent sugar dehydrogenase [Candidatus Harrisonbacteria bacterium]
MKKLFIILAIVIAVAGALLWQRYGGLLRLYPAPVASPTIDISGLRVPDGFQLSVLRSGLMNARVLQKDTLGNFWVSQPSEGLVTLVEMENGEAVRAQPVFAGLRDPHGLAFDPDDQFLLYIGEEHRVSRVRVYSEDELVRLVDLPYGSGHHTRTIGIGPDDMLYVSVGSSCNVCNESDARRATIMRSAKDGGGAAVYAKGLRNAVFFTWRNDGKMFATEMGRDLLGDDIPPDEIDIIAQGENYGWPICYGKNIHDTEFDKNTYVRNPCMEPFETPSFIDIPAHSAPLGLAFIPANSAWPREYWNDLLVAYHGSWNRSVPTGYKIVRYDFDARGNYTGQVE